MKTIKTIRSERRRIFLEITLLYFILYLITKSLSIAIATVQYHEQYNGKCIINKLRLHSLIYIGKLLKWNRVKQNIGSDIKPMRRSDTLRIRNMVFVLVFFLEVYIFHISREFKIIFDIVISTTDAFKMIKSAVSSSSSCPQK